MPLGRSTAAVAWTRADDVAFADRLVGQLLPGGLMKRPTTGRLCPRCGSSQHGRPFLRGVTGTTPHISLSRTTGATVLAMSWSGRIGVDVESLDRFSDVDLRGVVLHPEERAATPEALARTWVRKEALLKVWGHGLSVDPRSLRIDDTAPSPTVAPWPPQEPPGWLHDLELAPGLVAALAGDGNRAGITVREVAQEALRG
ncbi:hypothetical protein BH10ACT10_BH10ACT10_00160 [soil metagenome]